MYHRFEESKYPSTNIQLDVFKKQLKIIEDEGIKFIHPKNFELSLSQFVSVIEPLKFPSSLNDNIIKRQWAYHKNEQLTEK